MSETTDFETPPIEMPPIETRDAELPADLPPVEPPTAGFIAQLFLIPALIVGVLVAVYLLFGKIAGGNRTPKEYLDDLRGANEERRWLAAHELALFLQHDKKWQNDSELAGDLAAELKKSLDGQATNERVIQYQKYLASALGAFNSEVGVDVLAATLRSDAAADVRLAAVWSFARLGDRLQSRSNSATTSLTCALPALAVAAQDDDAELRKLAAYALGCVGLEEASMSLTPLLTDDDREVRYNAACAMARLANDAGFDTIEEMLTPELLRKKLQDSGLHPSQIEQQMAAVPLAAIESLAKYLERSPGTGIGELRASVESLEKNGTPLVRTRARELLIRIQSGNPKN